MKPVEFIAWREDFESEAGVIRYIVNSINFDPETENPSDAGGLLVFSTARQRVWLIATSERLYCILDDLRKEKSHISWSIPRRKLISDGTVSVKLRSREKNELSGFVDIGEKHTGWLYTKQLFANVRVENKIRSLIQRKMIETTRVGS